MSGATSPALEVRDLSVRFGGLTALDSVDLHVRHGSRHGILGPNGSGKTTLFNAISGFVRPRRGRILLHGAAITGLAPHRRARLGLGRTFQITSLFPTLAVRQNVALAVLARLGKERDWWRAADEREANDAAAALLDDLGLGGLAPRAVGSLGYGEQRQLEIAVALGAAPRVLLLDEPSAGLSVAETAGLVALIARLPPELTILLIEHDLGVVFELTDRLSVLQNGRMIADGPTDEVRREPVVKEVYLGR